MQSAHIHRLEARVPTTQVLLSRYQITISSNSAFIGRVFPRMCSDCEKKLNFKPKIKKLLVGALKLSERRNYSQVYEPQQVTDNSMGHNELIAQIFYSQINTKDMCKLKKLFSDVCPSPAPAQASAAPAQPQPSPAPASALALTPSIRAPIFNAVFRACAARFTIRCNRMCTNPHLCLCHYNSSLKHSYKRALTLDSIEPTCVVWMAF